jgi:hypothetical protein
MNTTKHGKEKIEKKHRKYIKKHTHKNTRKYERNTENTNILPLSLKLIFGQNRTIF